MEALTGRTAVPFVSGSPVASTLVTVAIAWITWRIWTFTIRPMVFPLEPKEYPYMVPVVGHAVAFFKDTDKVITSAREYFGNTCEPFAITVAGQRLYMVTSPRDVSALYKNTATLTFDEFVHDMMESLGMSKTGLAKSWEPSNSPSSSKGHKALPHIAEEVYRKQFQPGELLTSLWHEIQNRLDVSSSYETIPASAIRHETSDHKRVSLWLWCRSILFESVTTAIFGESLLQLTPNLAEVFAAFDDNSWKLTYKLPPAAARDMHKAKDQIKATFERYLRLPRSERNGAAWVIGALEDEMRDFGLDESDMAVLFTMPLWVINSNAYKLCFWLLAHIVHDPGLYASIKSEVDQAIAPGVDGLHRRLEQCQQLVAAYYEMLRLNTASASIRGIAKDTTLGNSVLRAGNKAMVPYRQLHMSREAWGANAAEFDPTRFLDAKSKTRSSSFRPFGGGTTYCAGTYIAMREILCVVALVLHRFELSLPEDATRSSQYVVDMVDDAMPSLGVLPPKPGRDVEVLVKKATS